MLRRTRTLYYGWYIAATLAVTETITWGVLYYSFSVLIAPMEAEFGWSRGQLTGAFSLALFISAVMAIPVGHWLDRHGARLSMTVGSALGVLLVLAWASVESLLAFYLIWAGLGVIRALTFYEPAFTVIAHWFNRRRGLALAIVTFAAGFASTIFQPLTTWLVTLHGDWRAALVTLAVLLGVTTVPLHALVLRRRPSDLGLEPDGEPRAAAAASTAPAPQATDIFRAALRSPAFWWLTVAFTLVVLGANALRVHFIPLLLDAGFTPERAALFAGSIGAFQVVGRVIFAPLESRLSTRVMTAALFVCQMAAFALLFISVTPGAVAGFVLLFGGSIGATTLARASLVADLYGPTAYGRISSVMAFFTTLAIAVAPLGAGLLYDWLGSYQPMLAGLIVLPALAVGAVLLTGLSGVKAHAEG